MRIWLVLTLVLSSLTRYGAACAAADAVEAARPADHVQLQALMEGLVAALNDADIDRLTGCLADHFDLTFIDQRHVTDLAALKAYQADLERTTGITSLTFRPSIDAPARFLGADVAVCTGTSADSFTLRGGSTIDLVSRWTATLVREHGGWKVSTLQAGIGLGENPLIRKVRTVLELIAIVAAVAAGMVGLVVGILIGRRRVAA